MGMTKHVHEGRVTEGGRTALGGKVEKGGGVGGGGGAREHGPASAGETAVACIRCGDKRAVCVQWHSCRALT